MKKNYNLKEHFHSINLKRRNYLNELTKKIDLNLIQLEIMALLYEFPEQNTFTKIMKEKEYAKSFVSTTINDLVKRGYVKKVPLPSNKKVFTLVLEDNCKEVIEEYYKCIEKFQIDAFKGISDEEFQVFKEVLNKMSKNLSEE